MTINDGTEKLASAQAGVDQPVDGPTAIADPMQKYTEERNKRIRAEGIAQYIDLYTSDRFRNYDDDLWIDPATDLTPALKDGDHCKYLIVGAGFGGLLFAVKLIKAGISVEDIRIVDSAGGFGGTWYWNRYPGLMCDVESFIYLPLLEETGYMPKHKYSYGPEILNYANHIADKYHLRETTSFQMKTNSLLWNEESHDWSVSLTHKQTSTSKGTNLTITAQFAIVAGGVLNNPKLPDIEGIESFQGHSFHTSRWDYRYTGGTPTDQSLLNLKDKTVGIIGTGATCVQALPYLAKSAKEVYVFQRTPSAVDARNNKPTEEVWFKETVARKKDWQRERSLNFNAFVTNTDPKPMEDMVADNWTNMPSFSVLIGSPVALNLAREKIPDQIGAFHAMDYPRQEGIRQRIASVVKDPVTAESLKPYYAGWCKRPCFHDDYLPSFNAPNVHLVDTNGKGIEKLTSSSVIVNGKPYSLDCLIFGTGFRTPVAGSPGSRAGIAITGRNGLSLDDKWTRGVATLHGVCSRDFPNLFFPGPPQAAASANQMFVLDTLSTHVAYIITKATATTTQPQAKITIEPTHEAEEAWATRVLSVSGPGAALIGCTPGYLNSEGGLDAVAGMSQEEQMRAGRSGVWGAGINHYLGVIEAWRDEGKLEGLEVKTF